MFISIRKPHFGNKAYFASIRNNKSNGLSSRTSNNLYGCGKRIMMDLGMTVSCAFLCQHVSYWNTTDSSLNFLMHAHNTGHSYALLTKKDILLNLFLLNQKLMFLQISSCMNMRPIFTSKCDSSFEHNRYILHKARTR